MEISKQEIFGPVIAIQTFYNEAIVIQESNNSPQGLAGYVFSSNQKRYWRIAENLELGMLGINDSSISTKVTPFGGVKKRAWPRRQARGFRGIPRSQIYKFRIHR